MGGRNPQHPHELRGSYTEEEIQTMMLYAIAANLWEIQRDIDSISRGI